MSERALFDLDFVELAAWTKVDLLLDLELPNRNPKLDFLVGDIFDFVGITKLFC